jgi:shikimate kinase / 3-dehydroquinate synthase
LTSSASPLSQAWLPRPAAAIVGGDVTALTDAAVRAIRIKAAIVTADEREQGQRLSLNYGHTFAHAIEHVWELDEDRHGEAVSLGMMAAAFLARRLGRIDGAAVASHERVLRAFGLPVRAPLEGAALERAWLRDKKYRKGVRFVLLTGIGAAEGGIDAPRKDVLAALKDLAG